MDGSYGNVFPAGRAMPPGPTASSNTNQYKINVNRQKTKKWANFKPQNYDGDDWGADDDDDVGYEPEPAPPPKPFGPRHPTAYSPTARHYQPPGSPSQHTPSNQFSGPVGPSRRATEPIGSPAHNVAGHDRPAFSPDDGRASPAPQSHHPLPSQRPPRQGSMGPGGVTNVVEAANSKPGTEIRSITPQSASSRVSSNKQLPFIRPADVYRRMEAERERERQSSLEAGTPGADGTAGEPGVPSMSEIQQQAGGLTRSAGATAGATTGARVAQDTAENISSGRVLKSVAGQAPIADRISADGLGTEEAGAGPAPAQEQVEAAESRKSVQPVSHEELRRFSKSPQLPDLGRMSGFGDDFFSSSFFPSSELRSPVSDSVQLPTPGQSAPAAVEPAAPAAGDGVLGQSALLPAGPTVASSTTPGADPRASETKTPQSVSGAGVDTDASRYLPSEPEQDMPRVGLPSHQDGPGAGQSVLGVPEQQAPAEGAPRKPTLKLRSEGQLAVAATAPSVPGGGVSKTPSTPAEAVASPSTDSAHLMGENKAAGSKRAPPSGTDVSAPSGTPPLSGAEPPPLNSDKAAAAGLATVHTPERSHPASPHTLPPLRASSPALTAKPHDMGSLQAPPDAPDHVGSLSAAHSAAATESEVATPTSAATERAEITPTAPLNPRRGTLEAAHSIQPVLPSPPIGSESVLDVTSGSPVKDSDMLSEEIIKSLTPAQPTGSEGSTAAYHTAAPDLARESTYLGDVYGDYWAATEDKAEPGSLTVGKTSEREHGRPDPPGPAESRIEETARTATALGSGSPSSPPNAGPAQVSETQAEPAPEAEGLRRRFSWEAALEGPVPAGLSPPGTGLLVEQKVLGSGLSNVAPSAANLSAPKTESVERPSVSESDKSADDLRAETAPELLAPTPPTDGRRESPLPVSALTDGASANKRMSLAEEKIALQESANSLPPSPPLEQHPVFAAPEQPRQAELQAAPSPKNVMGLRNIMELPSPSERIKQYNESRWQVSATDTGLDNWLKEMMARYPEHANAMLSSSATVRVAQQSGQGASQMPGHGARAPAHLHMAHLQQGLAGIGHSGNQMGTKSKELLMAAGKAGKGLLSKGRNKLRGTGRE